LHQEQTISTQVGTTLEAGIVASSVPSTEGLYLRRSNSNRVLEARRLAVTRLSQVHCVRMTVDVGDVVAAWPEYQCPEHVLLLAEARDALVCPRGHSVVQRDGIPRFVEDAGYAAAFGEQWNRYRVTQLDSYTRVPITERRVRRCIGEDLWSRLSGKQLLECGCGAGRFTEVLLARGASVTSIDLSSAVDANRANCPIGPRHRLAQADLRKLPFAPRQFDIVFCLGVVQHTPDSDETIERLYDQVKPGGTLVIDHYRARLSWYARTAPLFRLALKRLPPGEALRWTEKMVDVLLPVHRAASRWVVTDLLLSRISPVQSYYRGYPELDAELQRQWALLDTHDALTDWYKRFRTVAQIDRSLRKLGLVDIWCAKGGNGVEARGRRPGRSEGREA
jgi:SAM-dependent methyltransferase